MHADHLESGQITLATLFGLDPESKKNACQGNSHFQAPRCTDCSPTASPCQQLQLGARLQLQVAGHALPRCPTGWVDMYLLTSPLRILHLPPLCDGLPGAVRHYLSNGRIFCQLAEAVYSANPRSCCEILDRRLIHRAPLATRDQQRAGNIPHSLTRRFAR